MKISAMARCFALLIQKGSKTIDDVPNNLKEQVEYLLENTDEILR